MKTGRLYNIGGRLRQATLVDASGETRYGVPVSHLVYIPRTQNPKAGHIMSELTRTEDYLLLDFTGHGQYEVFQALRCTHTLELEQFTEDIHPVTGMSSGRVLSGPPRAIKAVEHVLSDVAIFDHKAERSYYFIGEKVSVGDTLDGKQIRGVRKISGVYRVEVF